MTRATTLSAPLLLLLSALACAQGTDAGPNMGGGTGTGGGMPTGAPAQSSLDLPMAPPKAPITPPAQVPEEDDDDDDPRDTPPPTIYGEEIDTENDTIYYVIDISYSMTTDRQSYTTVDNTVGSGNRMERAKAELIRSVNGLSDNFSFNVIAYDCSTMSWQSSMQEANAANKAAAIGWVTALRPRGATGTGPATALALAEKSNMSIVLLTDGSPNCGASGTDGHRSMIANANSQGAAINVFGIAATGRYRAFCQAVAGDSGGSYFDVP